MNTNFTATFETESNILRTGINDGKLSVQDISVYSYLKLMADRKTGVVGDYSPIKYKDIAAKLLHEFSDSAVNSIRASVNKLVTVGLVVRESLKNKLRLVLKAYLDCYKILTSKEDKQPAKQAPAAVEPAKQAPAAVKPAIPKQTPTHAPKQALAAKPEQKKQSSDPCKNPATTGFVSKINRSSDQGKSVEDKNKETKKSIDILVADTRKVGFEGVVDYNSLAEMVEQHGIVSARRLVAEIKRINDNGDIEKLSKPLSYFFYTVSKKETSSTNTMNSGAHQAFEPTKKLNDVEREKAIKAAEEAMKSLFG